MKDINNIGTLYLTSEYVIRNPSLHEEDTPWKVGKIIPLIDRVVDCFGEHEINLLDVGGGAGSILDAISAYIEKSYAIKVNRFSLDLSPDMLKVQTKRNPRLKKALTEDICETSLADKEVDLTLMIDVLEHIPEPIKALEEIKRISRFAIFKVPLEDNLFLRALNFIQRGQPRQGLIEKFGHINIYRFSNLRDQIEKHSGQVLEYYFTNVFDHFLKSEHYRKRISKRGQLVNSVAACVFKLSPKLCSLVFNDFVMILIECY